MATAPLPPERPLSHPFGIAWFILYGYYNVPAATFLPAVRSLGASQTKVYLFWQQIEPEPGRFDWTAVDAFACQLSHPNEGLVSLFSASLWATEVKSAMLPPSPARNLDAYYQFVFATVKRCAGRVRYWQNDAEPNNPVFWSGSNEAYIAQLKAFYRAVKDADPAAVVLVGGHDGLFVPPGPPAWPGQRTTPFPRQEEGLALFDAIFASAGESFDLFDLRLYGDPYTIEARVRHMRERMQHHGLEKPIVCTEYGGPNLFEFPENRKYQALVQSWSQRIQKPNADGEPEAVEENPMARLYAEMSSLPPQTRMFMQGCETELEEKYQRIQARGIVMRNLLAFAAGVRSTLYWDLLNVSGPRDDLMTLMYGKIGLLGLENGELKKSSVSAEAFQRMTEQLGGLQAVRRISIPAQPEVQCFEVDRGRSPRVYVLWDRRDAFTGEDAPASSFSWTAPFKSASATDALGAHVPLRWTGADLTLPLSLTPVYLTVLS